MWHILHHITWCRSGGQIFPRARRCGCRTSQTSGLSLRDKVIVRQFAWANNVILAGYYSAQDSMETANNSQLTREVEERKFHRMAKVHNLLEMWQCSQNLCPTQKESRTQNKQMTAVGNIRDTEEIIKASWSYFQHDGAAAFELLQRSPLPPALSAKYLPGGGTSVLNVCRIERIDGHPS